MTSEERRLLAARAKIIEDQRAMLDKADQQKRGLTASESEEYNKLDGEFDRIDRALELERKSLASEAGDVRSLLYGSEGLNELKAVHKQTTNPAEYRDTRYENEGNRKAFRDYLRYGQAAIGPDHFRALQADSDTAGGYLVLPMAMSNRIIAAMNNEVFIRNLATIYPLPKAESLGAPVLDTDIGDPTWTAEIGAASEDSDMAFGRRELTPTPIARLIKVSNKLLRAASIDAESLVVQRLVYKFATVQEYNFLLGDGSGKPMGVFVAATAGLGISTDRDVSTGNTSTGITTDGLIEAFYGLKAQYRKRATWIFHRDAIKKIRKLKDGEGQYIWQLGLQADRPPTILGAPYCESEYCPNTFTSGQYVGIVGDFSNYWIAESLSMQIQRLIELYAVTNQVGFIGRMEVDGMPALEEAFSRVTLST